MTNNELLRFSERREALEDMSLQEDVVNCGAFAWTCDHTAARRLGCMLVEKVITSAANDNVQSVDFLIGNLLELGENLSTEQGEAFKYEASDFTFGLR